ncbi:glycoside hydrolase family 18 protein [Lysobacter soli]|uniref:glycoside hydrolase family 18 protein n=1 Tax=Lysobacter soli TaxID=453783 RepID=UPI00209D41E6|nr:glycoside hydrolase family 18 protein [Lysobacter soli]UTA52761.1 glycoside hydrolase family 18 protein [Lysobacter soli]
MLRQRLAAVAIVLSAISASSFAAQPIVGAYYPGGNAARYPVSNIPADTVTHLFYAFARIEDGRCVVEKDAPARFKELAALKKQHPKLRTIISIGGWEAGGFSDAALTKESRERFVSSCVAMFFDTYRGSFDGVDLDWEFPVYGGPKEIAARPEDRENATLLANEFRRQLDAKAKQRGQSYLLTAALPAGRMQSAGPYDPAKSYDLKALGEILDFINLMTYDMGTAFSTVSTFNAPLREVPQDPLPPELRRANNVEGAVDFYLQHGVPADKLVLGVPFYGRGFRVKSADNHGLYQAYTGPYAAGDWRDIQSKLLKDPKWTQHWHDVAQTPYLFNTDERVFVSFEDAKSIALRSQLAKERGLRGVFMWELTGDDDQRSLLKAMAAPFETSEAVPTR